MLGQLQEKGSINTLAHYLDILAGAFLIKPIPKWSPKPLRTKASSPKLVVLNNALINSLGNVPPTESLADKAFRGRLVENAVGAALVSAGEEVYYWNDGDMEVDIYQAGNKADRCGSEKRCGRKAFWSDGICIKKPE